MHNATHHDYLPAKNILLIEDDRALSDLIAKQLRADGYMARQCYDGLSGLHQATQCTFCLVLLDVLLPEMDGFTVLSELRQKTDTPVIMLSARGAEEDRICGFRTGADDYLAKPFNPTELILRIEAILRRAGTSQPKQLPLHTLSSETLTLQGRYRTAMVANTDLELTTMEFRLLWMLVEKQGETLSKSLLYEELMGRPFNRYERSLDMHISKLRKKLSKAGFAGGSIRTMHGKGYCFK